MRQLAAAALIGIVAGLVRQSFFASLPGPWSAVDPAILLVVAYVIRLSGTRALTAGAAAGAAMDGLSALPFGSHTLAYAAAAVAAYLLFTVVFTSHDWPGILMITVAGQWTAFAVIALARSGAAIMDGASVLTAFRGAASARDLAVSTIVLIATMTALLASSSWIRTRSERRRF